MLLREWLITTCKKEYRMRKIFYPSLEGTLKIMTTIFVLVLIVGSLIHFVNQASYENWMIFFKMSSLYCIVCFVIYLSIKSQRIIVESNKLILTQLGFTRYEIPFESIIEVQKGKLNGSPIMEIETLKNGYNTKAKIPYLPFEKEWNEILQLLKENCGEGVVGTMTLVRNKGELRTWVE